MLFRIVTGSGKLGFCVGVGLGSGVVGVVVAVVTCSARTDCTSDATTARCQPIADPCAEGSNRCTTWVGVWRAVECTVAAELSEPLTSMMRAAARTAMAFMDGPFLDAW